MVNGQLAMSGMVPIALNPGETKTYRITVNGSTQSAYGFIRSNDTSVTSIIEGNLTYFVTAGGSSEPLPAKTQPVFANGNTLPHEGVGVPPSMEFYKTTIPFEDFLTVALALVNANVGPDANVTLTIFDNTGQQQATKTIPIGPFWHFVTFLWQQFPSLNLGAGRLDIESDRPIFGTALLFLPGASGDIFSSLPLLGAPYAYTFSGTAGNITVEGEFGIWTEGPFVKGYIRLTKAFGLPVNPVEEYFLFGQTWNGDLAVTGYGFSVALGGAEVGIFAQFDDLDLSAATSSGRFILANITLEDSEEGPLMITRIF
jgi:hypothetical protein